MLSASPMMTSLANSSKSGLDTIKGGTGRGDSIGGLWFMLILPFCLYSLVFILLLGCLGDCSKPPHLVRCR